MLHAIGFRASDAHANPPERLGVEGIVLGILLGGRRRRLVQEVAVGPKRVGEAQCRCLANLQRELPVALAFGFVGSVLDSTGTTWRFRGSCKWDL